MSLWLGAQAIHDAGPRRQNRFVDVISEYPGAFVHAQPGGMLTQTVVVVDTSEMPNSFSSITLYWPAECIMDCAGEHRRK